MLKRITYFGKRDNHGLNANSEAAFGQKMAIYICDGFGNTERYRCLNLVELMKDSKEWSVAGFELYGREDLRHLLKRAGLVVMVRVPYTRKIGKLVEAAREEGVSVLYDVDDLVCCSEWSSDLLEGLDIKDRRKERFWRDFVSDHEKAAKMADGFLVTNEFLGEKIKRSFGKPYKVIKNSLNKEQLEVSERCLKMAKKDDGGFKIGYFSGSPTHTRDFAMAEPELIRFLLEHDDVVLEIVGYMELSGEMQELVGSGRVKVKKPVDYLKLQELMAEVDVNIAPLMINDFTNCKSELKFFEAAAVETTTIASPTYAFKNAISDGKNGFLAQPGEWYDKLEYLYNNPDENRKIAKAAKKYALKHYYGEEFLKEVEEAYDYFAK